jgi:hypothetical protein
VPPVGYKKRRHKWTEDEILGKIRDWTETYGEPPSATDWNPSDCMKTSRISSERAARWAYRAERFWEGEWPWTGTVYKKFGGWNKALTAAGVEVRWKKRRTTIGEEIGAGSLDTDDLRRLVDDVEKAMMEGDPENMVLNLTRIATRASSWASEVDGE